MAESRESGAAGAGRPGSRADRPDRYWIHHLGYDHGRPTPEYVVCPGLPWLLDGPYGAFLHASYEEARGHLVALRALDRYV